MSPIRRKYFIAENGRDPKLGEGVGRVRKTQEREERGTGNDGGTEQGIFSEGVGNRS